MAADHPDLPSFSVFLEGHQGGHRQGSERQRFAPTEASVCPGRAVSPATLKEPAMIGAMAPGETGALALEVGAPAWSFFGFFSLGLCTHRVGMGRAATFLVEGQLAGAVPGPVDSGAAKIFQLCGMLAEQPPAGAQVATTCSHKRFPAHRVDGAEVEIFPALRNGGERAGDGIIAGTSLRHKGFPAHRAGNDGLAGFSGLRKGGWPRDDAELGAGVWPVGKCVGTASGAPPRLRERPRRGGQKKRAGPKALLRWIRWG